MRIPPLPTRKHVRELGSKRLDPGTANPSSRALLSGGICVTRTPMVHVWHAGGQILFPFSDNCRGNAVREVTAV